MVPRKEKGSKKEKHSTLKQASQIVTQESLDEDFEDPINVAILQHLETLVKNDGGLVSEVIS